VQDQDPSVLTGLAPNVATAGHHTSVRATKRDYDYFAELDEKLARLWAEAEANGAVPGDNLGDPPT
jgi:hypothetical protein